jgi:hypothetical protein
MDKTLTVDEANKLQKLWMDLDYNAPEDEKKKVYRAMEAYPKRYFSVSSDGKMATAMIDGGPANIPMPLEECKKHWGHLITSKLAWQCPNWIEL